jgi:hypothetical protein
MGCECERVPPTADAPTGSMGEPRVCVAEQVRSLSQPERLRTRQRQRAISRCKRAQRLRLHYVTLRNRVGEERSLSDGM